MKVKLDEVASLARVGLATVDRVLNERGGVAPATAKKVIDAARQLGWVRSLPSVYRTNLRFEVLLGRREVPLFAKLNEFFEKLIPLVNHSVIIQRTFVDHAKPNRLAKAIATTRSDAIIVCGQEDDAILEAIATVTSAGVPVVAIMSDLPTAPRLAYVGINHHRAGRAAAFLLSHMIPPAGCCVVLCHSLKYRGDSERIGGFREALMEYRPDASLTEVIEAGEDEVRARISLRHRLIETNHIAAVYNAGASNSLVVEALNGRSNIAFVGHDLIGETSTMLRDGTMTIAIEENLEIQARRAIDVLLHRFGLQEHAPDATTLPFQIKVRDSVIV
ncbi:LacI family DNA-binding transcriptional regulator [Phyllobacterium chamaecytisi]|uniref:LacI family DNA-binding transcriptional regulator n=1 Tax=Phyllobacterium chamaecytisi TaxID=2876082 RepID=UPI001CCFCFF6|nr:LacI family DNA-binding transcriptional regulator [Phyllobacterium sp. KW56]MBZ9603274.1 LacI family DNA-binding transcriptional regulator [Phyllobacterium sp. KW56]